MVSGEIRRTDKVRGVPKNRLKKQKQEILVHVACFRLVPSSKNTGDAS